MTIRAVKAIELVKNKKVLPIFGCPHLFVVIGTKNYMVDLDYQRCTCPDHTERRVTCKHMIATMLVKNEIITK